MCDLSQPSIWLLPEPGSRFQPRVPSHNHWMPTVGDSTAVWCRAPGGHSSICPRSAFPYFTVTVVNSHHLNLSSHLPSCSTSQPPVSPLASPSIVHYRHPTRYQKNEPFFFFTERKKYYPRLFLSSLLTNSLWISIFGSLCVKLIHSKMFLVPSYKLSGNFF